MSARKGVTDEAIRAAGEASGWSAREIARRTGLSYGTSLLARIDKVRPETAPASAGVAVSGAEPAWQGYRPRAGWTEPERPLPARAAPVEVIRSVMLTDVHVPYQHRRNVECALGIIREVQPHETDLLGDVMELESLSRHPKSKPDLSRLAAEFYETNVFLDAVQEANGGRKTRFLEGNHCARASRYEAEYGELDGMLSVPKSLYLEPRSDYHRETSNLRGIEWIPLRMQPFTVRSLALLHGVFESQYHAWMNAMHLGPRCGARFIFSGHMHGFQSFTSPAGCTAFALPWLGDERRHVFQAYVKGKPRPWNSGVLIREECGETVTVTPVFIENGRALFGGRVVQAA